MTPAEAYLLAKIDDELNKAFRDIEVRSDPALLKQVTDAVFDGDQNRQETIIVRNRSTNHDLEMIRQRLLLDFLNARMFFTYPDLALLRPRATENDVERIIEYNMRNAAAHVPADYRAPAAS